MVAVSGSGWRLAPALVRLVEETDRLFPARSTASDGSIGDAAHASRDSDHNPDDGWVDAIDLTDDDAHGCDVGLLCAHLVASRDERVSYLIHKGTIWRGYDKPGLPAFTPSVYTGLNAHEHHLHVSVADAHRASTRAWWPQSQPAPTRAGAHSMFSYEYDAAATAKGDPPNVLILVEGGKQIRITNNTVLKRRRAAVETHLGPVDKTEYDAFCDAFGSVIGS